MRRSDPGAHQSISDTKTPFAGHHHSNVEHNALSRRDLSTTMVGPGLSCHNFMHKEITSRT